jgi:phosphate transport system protein
MDSPHYARQAFIADMQELEHELLQMASQAEQMVRLAVDSLVRLDTGISAEVMRRDDEVDRYDIDIEAHCLRLLALQNPTGSDLRVIGTAMKVTTDLERVGDLSVDIAKIALKIEKEMGKTSIIDIPAMANVVLQMLRESLEAFVRRDLDKVAAVCQQDDEVDRLYRTLREQLFSNMRKDPDAVVVDGWLFLAIHHLERIADHTVNIAERVNFMVTGELKQIALSHRSDVTE